MNDKEKYEMIAMCALALRDEKNLQYYSMPMKRWIDTDENNISKINNSINSGVTWRVKPEPKTQTVRLAWFRSSTGDVYPSVVRIEISDSVEGWRDFIDWADEAKTYEVPE